MKKWGWCWVTSRSGWLLELLTELIIIFTISTEESLTRTAFPFESMVEIYASYDKVDEFSLSWNLLRLKFLIYKTIFNQRITSEELHSYKWNGEITHEDKQVKTFPSQSSKLVWELETQFDRSFIHSRCEEGQRIFQTNIMRAADILSDWLIANITSWSQ